MEESRRPIRVRSASWAHTITRQLVDKGITPNQISLSSIGFALAGAAALMIDNGAIASVFCIICIQLRLLCNLFDGMVAIEGGKGTPTGILYNEFPDRIADSLLLVALGISTGHPGLGWFAALAAALTAYVRVFGGASGLPQSFIGPMAKQHRMAVMTAGLVINVFESIAYGTHYAMLLALAVIAFGSVATCITRAMGIAKALDK